MCLSVPAQIVEIHDRSWATVDVAGTTKRISIDLLEEVQLGDWVLLHVGFALQKIDREQAEETMALFNEMLAIPGAYSGEVALP